MSPSPKTPEDTGPETWVREALAQQEEHLKRVRSCTGINGSHANHHPGLNHSWDTFSLAPAGPRIELCWRCRVTRTDEDYQRKVAADTDDDRAHPDG